MRFVRLVLSFVFLLVVASLVACGSSQQTVAALHMSAGVARAICAAVGAVDGVISDEHTAPSGGVAASSGMRSSSTCPPCVRRSEMPAPVSDRGTPLVFALGASAGLVSTALNDPQLAPLWSAVAALFVAVLNRVLEKYVFQPRRVPQLNIGGNAPYRATPYCAHCGRPSVDAPARRVPVLPPAPPSPPAPDDDGGTHGDAQ